MYQIDVRVFSGLTSAQEQHFVGAAQRWSKVITGDLTPVTLPTGETIEGLQIDAQGADIDGTGGILGQAGPTWIRRESRLPVKAVMEFDRADLARMEANGTLGAVILHEMGHCLGLGTIWDLLDLVDGLDGPDPRFLGAAATEEYEALSSEPDTLKTAYRPRVHRRRRQREGVPVANTGGRGTFGGHWREGTFDHELMTGFVDIGEMPLSRLTVAALDDMGYGVDYAAADAYALPGTPPASRVHVCRDCSCMTRPLRRWC